MDINLLSQARLNEPGLSTELIESVLIAQPSVADSNLAPAGTPPSGERCELKWSINLSRSSPRPKRVLGLVARTPVAVKPASRLTFLPGAPAGIKAKQTQEHQSDQAQTRKLQPRNRTARIRRKHLRMDGGRTDIVQIARRVRCVGAQS